LDTLRQAAEEFFVAAKVIWPGLAASSGAALSSGEEDETAEPCNAEAAALEGLLTFEPGAFIYRSHREELNGKPLHVLQALARAWKNVLTLAALQNQCWGDTVVGEETVRSAVKVARAALRRAIQGSGISCADGLDPIPVVDRGTGRTAWRLQLP
jgi:DNA-binding response OmpR family regulator